MKELKKLQSVFQTLADYNRLLILKSIRDKDCSVGEIVASTKLSQPLVSHHLRALKENDFLQTNRKGPFIFYSLRDGQILYALDLFLELFKDSDIKASQQFRYCSPQMFRKFYKK